MRFDVYCDESHPDLLGSKNPKAKFMVIGSLWLSTNNRNQYKHDIHKLGKKYKIGHEFKWRKISPSRLLFYKELIGWFFDQGADLRFRCIAVDHQNVNLLKYHNNDQELGFYKFYCQMLHKWILDCNEYSIFCDYKSNREQDRLQVLRHCLQSSNLSSKILSLQAIRSKESVLVQLTDLLTGAVSARLNNALINGGAKIEIINQIEYLQGKVITPTHQEEQKLNVFTTDFCGGW